MNSTRDIRHALDAASRAATSLQLHLAWKQLECAIKWPVEVRYRPDQPRAPRGTSIGGQWIDDVVPPPDRVSKPRRDTQPASGTVKPPAEIVLAAGRRRIDPLCDGFSAGCQNGGTFGSFGVLKLQGTGLNLCWDCAVKFLGYENLPHAEQLEKLKVWVPDLRA